MHVYFTEISPIAIATSHSMVKSSTPGAKQCPSSSGEMRAQTNPYKCNFGLNYSKSTDAAIYRVSTDGN